VRRPSSLEKQASRRGKGALHACPHALSVVEAPALACQSSGLRTRIGAWPALAPGGRWRQCCKLYIHPPDVPPRLAVRARSRIASPCRRLAQAPVSAQAAIAKAAGAGSSSPGRSGCTFALWGSRRESPSLGVAGNAHELQIRGCNAMRRHALMAALVAALTTLPAAGIALVAEGGHVLERAPRGLKRPSAGLDGARARADAAVSVPRLDVLRSSAAGGDYRPSVSADSQECADGAMTDRGEEKGSLPPRHYGTRGRPSCASGDSARGKHRDPDEVGEDTARRQTVDPWHGAGDSDSESARGTADLGSRGCDGEAAGAGAHNCGHGSNNDEPHGGGRSQECLRTDASQSSSSPLSSPSLYSNVPFFVGSGAEHTEADESSESSESFPTVQRLVKVAQEREKELEQQRSQRRRELGIGVGPEAGMQGAGTGENATDGGGGKRGWGQRDRQERGDDDQEGAADESEWDFRRRVLPARVGADGRFVS